MLQDASDRSARAHRPLDRDIFTSRSARESRLLDALTYTPFPSRRERLGTTARKRWVSPRRRECGDVSSLSARMLSTLGQDPSQETPWRVQGASHDHTAVDHVHAKRFDQRKRVPASHSRPGITPIGSVRGAEAPSSNSGTPTSEIPERCRSQPAQRSCEGGFVLGVSSLLNAEVCAIDVVVKGANLIGQVLATRASSGVTNMCIGSQAPCPTVTMS